MVLLISPAEPLPSFEHLSVQEHVALLQSEYGLSEKEAIKMAAQLRDVPKRDIYKIIKTNQ
jgi:16S rRNA (cytidine1402-2'-O)-methyltransferase